jgi:hypothetical protein
MSTEQADPAAHHPPDLDELRAEVERLRAEVETMRQAQSDQAGAGASALAGQPGAQLTGSSIIGSPVIASQYNTTDAATTLEAVRPTFTLGLINGTQGTSTTGAPVGLYTAVRGIGIIVSAYGTAPFPTTSKAVQAYCELGVAVFADSRDNSAVYAHTTNGISAVVADQGSSNPRSIAVTALGGNGVGVYASGATAAVQLGRSSFAGAPTSGSHEAGELVLDANADLYLCKASGTPGTWNLIG